MASQSELHLRLAAVHSQIVAACSRVGRAPSEVTLVAVSKGVTAEKMITFAAVAAELGLPFCFGENYLAEFLEKRPQLPEYAKWHFIGRVQSNKLDEIVKQFNLLQSLDSAKHAAEAERLAQKLGIRLPVFLQINISADHGKSGFSPESARDFVQHEFPRYSALQLQGLMTITRYYDSPEEARPDFRALRLLRDVIANNSPSLPAPATRLLDLSMGMSHDFEIAIEEGATLVRIGTALFGERK